MKTETTLKIFGTGQITIPKEWRKALNSDAIKAVFDEKTNSISLKPVKVLTIEPFTPMNVSDFEAELKTAGLSAGFVNDAVSGFKKSSRNAK